MGDMYITLRGISIDVKKTLDKYGEKDQDYSKGAFEKYLEDIGLIDAYSEEKLIPGGFIISIDFGEGEYSDAVSFLCNQFIEEQMGGSISSKSKEEICKEKKFRNLKCLGSINTNILIEHWKNKLIFAEDKIQIYSGQYESVSEFHMSKIKK